MMRPANWGNPSPECLLLMTNRNQPLISRIYANLASSFVQIRVIRGELDDQPLTGRLSQFVSRMIPARIPPMLK